jgi:hypothetical protein
VGVADLWGAWDTEGWWDELKVLIFPFPWKKKNRVESWWLYLSSVKQLYSPSFVFPFPISLF